MSHAPAPHRPAGKELEILRALNRYFYLTAAQLCRLFYARGSLTFVKARLKDLVDGRYAEAVALPRAQSRGNLPYVYRLGASGLKLLRALDEPVPYRLRHSETPVSPYHVPHTLAVNDVLIAAELLGRDQRAVVLSSFVHERVLKLDPLAVTLPSGRTVGVIPDAVLDFDIADAQGEGRQYLVLEVDLGGKREYWQGKVERLMACPPAFRRRFDTDSFTLAVTTPAGEAHLHNLKRWTEEVFARSGQREAPLAANVFFTALPMADVAPEAVFLAPAWRRLFSDAPAMPLEVYLG